MKQRNSKPTIISRIILLFTVVLLFLALGPGSSVAYSQGPPPSIKGPEVEIVLVERPQGVAAPKNLSNIDRDIPHAPNAANITVNYTANGGCNWTWGSGPGSARDAFEYAVSIWEANLTSTVDIRVTVNFQSLPGTTLGSCGPYGTANWGTHPIANVWFPYAIADMFRGSDYDPGNYDIEGRFDCDASTPWYFGTDGNPGGSQVDFVSVALHELGHGLGFVGGAQYVAGNGSLLDDQPCCGWPWIYSCYTGSPPNYLLNTSVFPDNSLQLGTALTSNNVFFFGTSAINANGDNPVPLYAPSTWNGGSSYSHLAESFDGTTNALMTYSISVGEVQHNPGSVMLGMFNDIGWGGSIDNSGEACNNPNAVHIQSVTASPSTPALHTVVVICAILLLGAGAIVVWRPTRTQ